VPFQKDGITFSFVHFRLIGTNEVGKATNIVSIYRGYGKILTSVYMALHPRRLNQPCHYWKMYV